jgi:Tfp pilus assembly protein PilF
VDFVVAEAECLVALDRPDEALALLEESVDRLDDDGTVSALVAHVARLMGDPDRAAQRYVQALAASPGSKLVAAELGRLLLHAARYEEARAVLEPLLETSEGSVVPGGVRRTLAACYLALGDPASAKRVLIDYAADNQNDTLAQLLLAKSALATSDMLTALRAVDTVEQREPDRPELWLVRATVRWKRGKLAAAAADLYDVLQNAPNDVEARCLLAEVLRDQHRPTAARHQFRTVLKIDPSCAWAKAGLEALADAQQSTKKSSARLTSAKTPIVPVGQVH